MKAPVLLGLFKRIEDIEREFECQISSDISIIFAQYDIDGYEGDAHVVYEQAGKLYEVYGGHCSCYGLEGQWLPEKTMIDAIKMRKHPYRYELNTALDAWFNLEKVQ